MTGREIINVLEKYLTLEWFRFGALKDTNQLKYPPIIAWRYDLGAIPLGELKSMETRITEAVENFRGNVRWDLYFSGKNWVLLPKRVKDLEKSGEYRSDTEVLIMLGEKDPVFGHEANEDLPNLANFIESYLKR